MTCLLVLVSVGLGSVALGSIGWGSGGVALGSVALGSIGWGSSSIALASNSIAFSGDGWGSNSIALGSVALGSNSWGSNSVALGSIGWGSNSGLNYGSSGNGLVNGVAGLLDDRGLNNLLDRVDLVGLGNSIGLRNLDGVGPGNLLLVDDFALNRDWVRNGNVDGVLVDLELGLDAPDLRGDDGVGAVRGRNPLLVLKKNKNWLRISIALKIIATYLHLFIMDFVFLILSIIL